jgi:hypothetical protein
MVLACLRGDGGDGREMAEVCEWQSGYTCCVEIERDGD